ncbi:MAG: TIGR02099 family protein [Candidatus Accumulibacter sp.]|uniref:YhdP family protein n=1 Tax=Accumulibacter sp. TaxID=2053492 RepID=UPI0025FDC97F|nr:YhdP family protein [Accumulibacter sp.]MCM8599774.1 TIGR02099 family protein [Accumulibacter sp.]
MRWLGVMRQEELRPAIYHRLHHLLPVISHPATRCLGRLALRACWLLYFAFVLLILALRYLLLPNIESYRPEIERQVSQALGLAIAIGHIEASWDGIHPDLVLSDVRIADAQGLPALTFTRVESVLSWSSLPHLQLRLRSLRIAEPTLHIRRDASGHLFVAGIAIGQQESDSGVADWLLAQRRIRIHGATVVWEDAQRDAPPLVLDDVDLALDNDGHRHRFGLTGLPPAELASRIDLRGDFRGQDVEHLAAWKGQAFVQIDYADLAVWRTWLDYPVALPHGRGAVRAWMGIVDGGLRELTADLSLDDVKLRLARGLPELQLDHMSGRIGARLSASEMSVDGRHVALVTRRPAGGRDAPAHGVHIDPTDFHVEWQNSASEGGIVGGSATASALDLGALASLAAYLPLDDDSRRLLDDFAPRGHISGLRTSWRGNGEHLQTYSLSGRFADLALRPQGRFPGIAGLSGSLEASEQGGSAQLNSRKVAIELPDVFPESAIALDTLQAQARWKISGQALDLHLSRLEFAGPDASGSAQGSYHKVGDGPGSIDLTGALSRADARAVWRYLPATVNVGARHWLRDAIKTGTASETRLILKGDLAKFPFVDHRDGQFLVTVKAHAVTLDYATGWPPITGLDADLRFAGAGMVIQTRHGSILGTRLLETLAEIPDFDAPLSTLKVKGRVEGDTREFLGFIRQSPVATQIDHFTDSMSAVGKGHLEISLVIPLEEARLGDSKVEGIYTFLNNEVTVDPALPPLRQVKGSLQFSEKDLHLQQINALLFGGPVRIGGGAQGGKVLIVADGTLAMDELRRRTELPLFDKLSGTTGYRAEVRVRKRDVELLLDSNLLGIASTLPAPLGKGISDPLPLHFENTLLPGAAPRNGDAIVRDQLRASLGGIVSMQLIRRRQTEGSLPERGAIMIGRPMTPLPERGVNVGISVPTLDVDSWQNSLQGIAGSGSGLPVAVDLETDRLIFLGGRYNAAKLRVSGASSQWRGALRSREAEGDFQWDGSGGGRLAAHFTKWSRPEKVSKDGPPAEAIKELPALDIVVDDFAVGDHRFGRLDVQAHNDKGIWRIDKIELANPFGKLSGSGQWQVSAANRTQLNFALDSSDIGKLLDRIGYPGAVRSGKATMQGKIGWNGPPDRLDYATLSGEMTLEASKGQFLKLDPGAGKLLGLISLQGLPRRLSFDFGDVFSEGFAFDSIQGRITVNSGLMHTRRLQIDGPAAHVVMRGDADLKNETQNLHVTVQPELGSSAALGVAVIHPLAGVATLLADKLLQGPLNKVFAFEYLVTGKWDDPKVEKISHSASPTANSGPAKSANPTGGSNEAARQ